MKTAAWVIIGLCVIIAALIVGIIAGRVGGIAIRKQGADQHPLSIVVSEPIVRGVPVVVHWDPTSVAVEGNLVFDWRDDFDEYQLGEAPLAAAQVSLEFPCVATSAEGGLVVRSAADGKVLVNQVLTLAPAGPECVP